MSTSLARCGGAATVSMRMACHALPVNGQHAIRMRMTCYALPANSQHADSMLRTASKRPACGQHVDGMLRTANAHADLTDAKEEEVGGGGSTPTETACLAVSPFVQGCTDIGILVNCVPATCNTTVHSPLIFLAARLNLRAFLARFAVANHHALLPIPRDFEQGVADVLGKRGGADVGLARLVALPALPQERQQACGSGVVVPFLSRWHPSFKPAGSSLRIRGQVTGICLHVHVHAQGNVLTTKAPQ